MSCAFALPCSAHRRGVGKCRSRPQRGPHAGCSAGLVSAWLLRSHSVQIGSLIGLCSNKTLAVQKIQHRLS